MTNHESDALDAASGAALGGLLATLAQDCRPAADLVPAALAGARRAKRRSRLAWTAGGGLATAAAAVAAMAVAMNGGVGRSASATAVWTGPVQLYGAVDKACAGTWLPSVPGSDSILFGTGTGAQRAAVCTRDIKTLKALMPGLAIAPYFETLADGEHADITAEQIALMGSGLAPDTHILKPWQYSVTLNGSPAYFFVTYSAKRTDVCAGCQAATPQALPGPRAGYRLVGETPRTPGPVTGIEVLVETPEHAYLGIGVSPLTAGARTLPFAPDELVKDAGFVAALDADLRTLNGG
jgi:hypothetical protein